MRQQHKSPRAERRRTDILFTLVATLALAGFGFLVVTVQGLSGELRTANTARDALAQQVERLGGKPVAGPPGSRGEQGVSVVGPRGQRGATGPTGPVGPAGRAGPSGSPGAGGEAGADGVGAVGPSGAPGADGQSIVGPAGPKGDPGPAGPAGAPGKDGADGRAGADGQTCPAGYTLQPPPGDPDGLMCRRDSAPPPGEPASTPSPLSRALDPTRRQYP